MGRRKIPGLVQRNGIWHIDKIIKGYGRLCESTGEDSLQAAEEYLEKRIRGIKEASGKRPRVRWRDAVKRYLEESEDKSNILTELGYFEQLSTVYVETLGLYFGDLFLEQVHDGTLKGYVQLRRKQGRKTKTINNALAVVRHILNLSALMWRHDDSGLTWLENAPRITCRSRLRVEMIQGRRTPWIGRSKTGLFSCCQHI